MAEKAAAEATTIDGLRAEPESAMAVNATRSTTDDTENMRRMGQKQELVRHFRTLSVASFVAISTAAWEIGLFEITPGLTNGGRPVLVYSVLWNFIGFTPIYLSMAEMASMAPIAGAQYHWVSEFAPRSIQKPLSYLTGWTSSLAWQSGNAIGVFLVGTLAQSIISLNLPGYSFPPWHATLLVIGAVCIALAGNILGAKYLARWQNFVFVLHVSVYIVIIATIWARAPRIPHKQVWSGFENSVGWSKLSLSVMVGQLTGIYTQLGVDTAAHMAEEVQDAARTVPKVIMAVFLINFCIMFPAIITITYHIPDVGKALTDETTYPTIYVLRQALPDGGVTAILCATVALLIFSNITYQAAVTRDIYAFARDQGLPFASWIAKVDKDRAIPRNACLLTGAFSICLSLIYIGSIVAFYAITSLLTVALLQCYGLSVGCVLWRRIMHPETLPPSPFSLGRFGIPINILAVTYSVWAFFWSFWPQLYPVTAAGFNWASVIFAGVLLVAMIYYMVKGRKVYAGPVELIEARKVE